MLFRVWAAQQQIARHFSNHPFQPSIVISNMLCTVTIMVINDHRTTCYPNLTCWDCSVTAATPFLNSCPQSETAFKEYNGCWLLLSYQVLLQQNLLSTSLLQHHLLNHFSVIGEVLWFSFGNRYPERFKSLCLLLPSSSLLLTQWFNNIKEQHRRGCVYLLPR